jgi:hypothetical protein
MLMHRVRLYSCSTKECTCLYVLKRSSLYWKIRATPSAWLDLHDALARNEKQASFYGKVTILAVIHVTA